MVKIIDKSVLKITEDKVAQEYWTQFIKSNSPIQEAQSGTSLTSQLELYNKAPEKNQPTM